LILGENMEPHMTNKALLEVKITRSFHAGTIPRFVHKPIPVEQGLTPIHNTDGVEVCHCRIGHESWTYKALELDTINQLLFPNHGMQLPIEQ
jgi:hypothetical protein